MLSVCAVPLPPTDITYMAFRLAFYETLERIELANQVGLSDDRCFGYLTEVPFLKPVPPQVQLDQLLQTWAKHLSLDHHPATLADEAVIYAACETAARIVSCDIDIAKRYLRNGPRPVHHDIDPRLASTLQALHLDLPNEGDFLLISQFLDMPPEEANPYKTKFGMVSSECDTLFDLLGRWHVSSRFRVHAHGLLTSQELSNAAASLKLPRSSAPR